MLKCSHNVQCVTVSQPPVPMVAHCSPDKLHYDRIGVSLPGPKTPHACSHSCFILEVEGVLPIHFVLYF